METRDILAAIDEEIRRLEQVRALLGGKEPRSMTKIGTSPRRRGKLSAEARARIAAAQKARWAKQKAGK